MLRCVQSGMKISENYYKILNFIPKQLPDVYQHQPVCNISQNLDITNTIGLDCKTFVKIDKAPCIHYEKQF